MRVFTFLDRLEGELEELEERYNRLVKFESSETYANLEREPKLLLIEQAAIMKSYILILRKRIVLAKAADPS